MTCVVGTSDGAELGSAGHEYAHAAIERTLASSGAALPSQWALQDLADCIKALQEAVPAAVRAVGTRRQGRPRGAKLATLVSLGGGRFRLLVSEGEVLDTAELPNLEMPYGHFRPDSGLRACTDAWLRLGGPHHQVLNPGRHADTWRTFCELAGLEFAVA